MGQIFFDVFAIITTLFAFIFTLLYLYFRYAFSYWERRNIPSVKPSFPFGNVRPMFTLKKSMGQNVTDLYNSIDAPFFGMYIFATPRFVVKDPLLAKLIMVKDFQYFQDRGNEVDPVKSALAANLFSLPGTHWKNLRNALTPAFTSGKLKLMMNTVIKCGQNMQNYLNEKADIEEILEFKDLAARYTTDIISSVAMGIDVNSIKNPNDEFRNIGRRIFDFSTTLEAVKNILFFSIPEYLKPLRLSVVKPDVHEFMTNVVAQTVNYRENNGVVRNDFMQLLIQLRNGGIKENDDMKVEVQKVKHKTLEEITAEVNLFFLAGFETSSITMSSFFYEMARHPDIMRKAQADVDAAVAKHGGFNYDAMNEMKYLENCINETLRIYTALPFLVRECSIDYKIPGHDAVIPKGIRVLIPMMALHRDPKHFPNPMEFDPDRFNEDRKNNIQPYTYIPFGEGQRNCIGMRLGKMQVKVGLAMVLQKYDILSCSKTSKEFKHDPKTAGVVHLGGIWLKIAHRKH